MEMTQIMWSAFAREILFERELRWEALLSKDTAVWTATVEVLRKGDPMRGYANASSEQVRELRMALVAIAMEHGFDIIINDKPEKDLRIAISQDTFGKYVAMRQVHGGSQPKNFWGELITPG